MHLPRPVPQAITVQRWRDAKSAGPVYAIFEPYLECYLPVLGPGSFLTLRHLDYRLLESDLAVVDLAELAAEVGLGRGLGHTSPVVRALNRLVDFRAACWVGSRLLVRLALPPVPEHLLDHLPARALAYHRLVAQAVPERLLETQASKGDSLGPMVPTNSDDEVEGAEEDGDV